MCESELNYGKIGEVAQALHNVLIPSNPDYSMLESYIEDTLGIRVLYTRSELTDGYLQWNSETTMPEIVLRSSTNLPRQRFTMAHELGHLFLHWKWVTGNDLGKQAKDGILDISPLHRGAYVDVGSLRELEADEFAGQLLMPTDDVVKVFRSQTNRDINCVKKAVAEKFCVSEPAAYVRLSNLKRRGQLS